MHDVRLSLGTGAARVDILRGANLSAEAGKSVAIVGPSGSGKSTLLMAMAGLERVDSGRITVAGVELSALSEDGLARFRRQTVGLVFQSFHLVPTMTALENVAIPLELIGAADAFERASRELALVGLGARLSHYPAELSGGEQQRVAIARALVARPPIVIADEPTGNLDSSTGQQIADLLFETGSRLGTTLVLVTHDEGLARRCHRVVHVRDGLVDEAMALATAGVGA
ncbi:MAG: ABC transporter ATP-binding protein [Ancalomicrobiaceae bacterium]|nr:ABC transporter ATP-binding protein [Ancalomicrobiaceae bacterium]